MYHCPLCVKPKTAEVCVQATVVLHNLLRMRRPDNTEVDREDEQTHEVHPGTWRIDADLPSLRTLSQSQQTQRARSLRERMKAYVNTVGAVPWQNNMI